MPLKTAIVGYARSAMTQAKLHSNIARYIKIADESEQELFDQFLQHNVYVQGGYDSVEDFKKLVSTVEHLEEGSNEENNRLFYLALPPTVFEPVTKLIHDHCMSKR